MRRSTLPLVLFVLAPLGGCATVRADADAALADLATAKTAIGIAKGIAGIAVIADPALAVIVDPLVSAVDAASATATGTATAATVDVATLQREVAALDASVAALEARTAQVVTVVPNASASAAEGMLDAIRLTARWGAPR